MDSTEHRVSVLLFTVIGLVGTVWWLQHFFL